MISSWLRFSAIPLLLSTVIALDLPIYPGLRTNQSRPGVLEIAFNNTKSEVNVWGEDALSGLSDVVQKLQSDTEIKVVLFTSDVPLYFLNHLDLLIQPFDTTIASRTIELLFNMTNLQQITIGAIEGVARGAGNEFLVSLDMRFATKTHTLLGQPEIGVGLIPGGGGSQYLPRLIGRGRAMEYILSGKDVDAVEAERIGWINKAFDTTAEMNGHIDDLISRMVLFPIHALGLAKQSINVATRPQLSDLLGDSDKFLQASSPASQALIGKSLELSANQSDGDIERFFGEAIPLLYN
ncbi:hypothetical protein BELL_0728g00030 [Botrytis elliptica]|uniref:Enoyl-CoA hydratase n=1 Tax=Botrytis elliptica TaxID=278938 RepID=A0A4Z1JGD3_9HELO|nr:hypothetical protein EAE99_011073 [Botrytis elliptica]TGO70422.1 hypothetical protein BELL_0728g00030 [Botrytis elliptica]